MLQLPWSPCLASSLSSSHAKRDGAERCYFRCCCHTAGLVWPATAVRVCVHASACLCLLEARALLITNAQRLHCQLPLPLTLPHQSSTFACTKFFDPTCIHYSSNPDSPAEPLSATHCVISRYEQHTALHWQHLYCTAKHRTAQDAHTRPTAIGLALRQLKNEIERGKHRHHRDLTAAAPLHCVTGQIHPFDRPHYRQRTQSKPINHPQPCPAHPPESIFLSSLTSL